MQDEKKLEIGMYVRLDRCQGIAKIEEIGEGIFSDKEIVDEWGNETFRIEIDDILKASDNIIDLIEIDDVLNIKYENKEYICKVVNVLGDKGVQISSNFSVSLDIVDIKSIVTKEQFQAMSYKIGGNHVSN